jgi:hypothetical protein
MTETKKRSRRRLPSTSFQPTDDDERTELILTLTGIDVTDNDQRNMNLFLSHGCRLVDDDDDDDVY